MEHLYSVTPLLEDHFEERGMKNVYMYNDLLTSVANRDKNTEGLLSYASWDKTCDNCLSKT